MKKRSTLFFRQLLVTALCLFGFTTAHAQYTVTTEQLTTSDYSNTGENFKLTEIAAALGTDTASLAKSFANIADEHTFVAIDSTGTVTGYTGNAGEFWLNRYGQVHTYDGAAWFIGARVDATQDQLYIYAGQMPNYFPNENDTVKAQAAIVYGGKQVTFDISLIIKKLVNPTDGILSNISIVGEKSVTIHQLPRSSYASDKVTVAVPDLAEKLGLTNDELTQRFAKIPYAQRIDATYGTAKDTISNESTATAPGFWYAKTQDATGTYTNNLAAQTYGDSCRIYVQGLALNATCDTISADLGQYPGHVHAGDSLIAPIYYTWGQKAYKVTYNLVVDQPTITSLDDMTKVGERTDTIHGLAPNTNYSYEVVTYPIAEIAQALSSDTTALSLQGITADGNLSTGSTANNGGYWMTKDGKVTSWGTGAAFFCEPEGLYDATHPKMGTMHVGLFTSGVNEGDTLKGALYLTNADGTMYYQLNLVIPVEKKKTISGLDIVKTLSAAVQVIKSTSDYIADGNQTKYYVTPDQANALIGTSTPSLYSLYADSTWTADGGHKYNKDEFICSPAPGFWLGKQGQAHGWSNNDDAPVGICYDQNTGLFTVYQAPGATGNVVGGSYKASLFLANDETQKAIQVDFTISWVNKLEEVADAGTININLPVSASDTSTAFPIDSIAKLLGTDAATLLASYSAKGRLANGTYSEGVDIVGNGLMFQNDGSCDNEGGNIGINLSEDGKTASTYANNADDISENFSTNAVIAFDYTDANGKLKRVTVNVTFMDPTSYEAIVSGINSISVDKKATGRIYNLNGQEVSTPAHGIFIINGKKYIFK